MHRWRTGDLRLDWKGRDAEVEFLGMIPWETDRFDYWSWVAADFVLTIGRIEDNLF